MIKPHTCPICHKLVISSAGEPPAWFPFCSERCRNVDMFRWADGRYAIVENISDRQDLLEEYLAEMEQHPPDEETDDDHPA